jgi:hypothetical protein
MAQFIQALLALVVLSAAMGLALMLFARRFVSSLQEIRGSTKPLPVAAVRAVGALLLVAGVAGFLVFFVL